VNFFFYSATLNRKDLTIYLYFHILSYHDYNLKLFLVILRRIRDVAVTLNGFVILAIDGGGRLVLSLSVFYLLGQVKVSAAHDLIVGG
jgi:hypothetical protein